jgi:endogenous inhibitor of DNA gyrase (YacG/DUF329 family)
MACPICRKPTLRELRPFCSRRCKDIDLARWLAGAYVIPGPSATDEGEPPPAAASDEGEPPPAAASPGEPG